MCYLSCAAQQISIKFSAIHDVTGDECLEAFLRAGDETLVMGKQEGKPVRRSGYDPVGLTPDRRVSWAYDCTHR